MDMNRDDAKVKLTELAELMQHALYAIDNEKKYQGMEAKQSATLKVLQDQIGPLRTELWQAKKLLSAYHKTAPTPMCFCPECYGEGGHTWETEEGTGVEPCQLCEESGIVPTSVAEQWESTRKIIAPPVAPDQSEESNQLPF